MPKLKIYAFNLFFKFFLSNNSHITCDFRGDFAFFLAQNFKTSFDLAREFTFRMSAQPLFPSFFGIKNLNANFF